MNWQRIQAKMEQESARLRDARPPVPVPELDLYLLVQFAFIGAASMIAHCTADDETRERAEVETRDRAQAVADALGKEGEPRREAGGMAAGKIMAVIADRYAQYLPGEAEK